MEVSYGPDRCQACTVFYEKNRDLLIVSSAVYLCTVVGYWLSFELASRFRLTPDSAAWIASFR